MNLSSLKRDKTDCCLGKPKYARRTLPAAQAWIGDRSPTFGRAGIKALNNGPICYTPDGCPLLGPVAQHQCLWLATGFCIGIRTGGGAGEYLAKWMVEGEPEYDLLIVYPSRFVNNLTRESCLSIIKTTYANGDNLSNSTA